MLTLSSSIKYVQEMACVSALVEQISSIEMADGLPTWRSGAENGNEIYCTTLPLVHSVMAVINKATMSCSDLSGVITSNR